MGTRWTNRERPGLEGGSPPGFSGSAPLSCPRASLSLMEAGSTSIRLPLCPRHWSCVCPSATEPPAEAPDYCPRLQKRQWGASEAARRGTQLANGRTPLRDCPAPSSRSSCRTSVGGIFPAIPASRGSEDGCSLKEGPEEKPGGWDHPAHVPRAPRSGLKEQAGWASPLGEPSGRQALRAEQSASSLLPLGVLSLACRAQGQHVPIRALLCMASCHPNFPGSHKSRCTQEKEHVHTGDPRAAATEQRQVIMLGSP